MESSLKFKFTLNIVCYVVWSTQYCTAKDTQNNAGLKKEERPFITHRSNYIQLTADGDKVNQYKKTTAVPKD